MVRNIGNSEGEINNNLSCLGKYFHTVQIDTETYLAYLRKVFVQKGERKLLQVMIIEGNFDG